MTCRKALTVAGWKVVVLWECEIRDQELLARQIRKFLGRAA